MMHRMLPREEFWLEGAILEHKYIDKNYLFPSICLSCVICIKGLGYGV